METVNQNLSSKANSIGAKIISVIYFATLIYILLYLISIYILGIFPGLVNPTVLVLALAMIFPFSQLSIFAVLFTALFLAIAGYGLWTARQWGKTLALTMGSVNLVFNIVNIFIFHIGKSWYTYTTMAFSFIVIIYLLFKSAKDSFKSNSKITNAVVSILTIAVCLAVGVQKFNEQLLVKNNNKKLNNLITTKPIGADCKVDESGNREIAVATEFAKNRIYTNNLYNFQINFPYEYTVSEGRDYKNCKDTFTVFSTTDGHLSPESKEITLSIEPSKSDYDGYFNDLSLKNPDLQKSDTTVSGLSAIKVWQNGPGPLAGFMLGYLVENKGYLYSIFRETRNVTEDEFSAIVTSFKIDAVAPKN